MLRANEALGVEILQLEPEDAITQISTMKQALREVMAEERAVAPSRKAGQIQKALDDCASSIGFATSDVAWARPGVRSEAHTVMQAAIEMANILSIPGRTLNESPEKRLVDAVDALTKACMRDKS
jgi:hypothetical protein